MFTNNQQELLNAAKLDHADMINCMLVGNKELGTFFLNQYNKLTDQVIAETNCELWQIIEAMSVNA